MCCLTQARVAMRIRPRALLDGVRKFEWLRDLLEGDREDEDEEDEEDVAELVAPELPAFRFLVALDAWFGLKGFG